jgi:predicted nucleic acid-binding protein
MKGIADTGFLVAFMSRNDRHHEWAVGVAEEFTEPLLTCEAVLSETAFHLGSCSAVLNLISQQLVTLAFDCKEHLLPLEALAKRYADRKPDLADLCLIRMTEVHLKHSLVTIDGDFRIYRRNKRDTIPLICPPDR